MRATSLDKTYEYILSFYQEIIAAQVNHSTTGFNGIFETGGHYIAASLTPTTEPEGERNFVFYDSLHESIQLLDAWKEQIIAGVRRVFSGATVKFVEGIPLGWQDQQVESQKQLWNFFAAWMLEQGLNQGMIPKPPTETEIGQLRLLSIH